MNILERMVRGRRQRRSLQALQQLDDHLLRDIGFERQPPRGLVGRNIGRL